MQSVSGNHSAEGVKLTFQGIPYTDRLLLKTF